MDGASRLGIQVGFDKLDDVEVSDGFFMRFEPYGQYVLPNRIVGIYGQLPISHAFLSDEGDVTALGNLDIGAFFLPFRDSSLVLRTGLALGTASDDLDEFFTNYMTTFERLTDFTLIAPDFTLLRLSGSTVQQSGMAFFRADLGLDVAIDKPSGADSAFLRANVAGGLRTSTVDLSAELVTLGNLDGDGSAADRFLHTLAFAFRTRGTDQFYCGMVFPLDDDIAGEVWILSLGYQHVLR